MKRVLGHLRRADEDYQMIGSGDTVAVGVSGGKDSMMLLYALHLYQNFCRVPFNILAVTVDLGFTGFDTAPIAQLCASLGVEFVCVKTNISQIVFDARNEKNPCALCAKMRKGTLFGEITRRGISLCAFAHHRDDCIESLFMSMLYEGRIRTFAPKTLLDRTGVTLIRPFVYLSEREITSAARRYSLPVMQNPCPAAGNTRRDEIKKLLALFEASSPKFRDTMLTALKNTAQYSLWDDPTAKSD